MKTNLFIPIEAEQQAMEPDKLTLKTRQYFADLSDRIIEDTLNGKDKPNDPEKWIEYQEKSKADTLAGKNDHTFTHLQMKEYFRTGICHPLLP